MFTWWQWLLIVLAGLGLAFLIVMQTPWYKVRKYAMDLKKIYDKHKLEEKAEAAQGLSQNPNLNPVLLRKPLRELISAHEALIEDLNKMKVPQKCQRLHELSVGAAKESVAIYQMAMIGGFRQKALMDKQKKVQKTQELVQAEMERIYGKLKEPKKK